MQWAQNGKVLRRDATGHLNPKYAADLRKRSLASVGRVYEAFVDGPHSRDPLAAALGEEFIASATTGDEVRLAELDERIPEDDGGPFIITRARDEFAHGPDGSNPRGSTREPFPMSSADERPEEEDALDSRE